MTESTADRVHRVDLLDEAFHKTAAELFKTLAFANSPEAEGQRSEAFGKAVTLARKLVAAEEKLQAAGGHCYEDAA